MIEIDIPCPPSEYDRSFLKGMIGRMAVSFAKYGAVGDAYPHKVNAIKSLRQRLERYEETGNAEWLIDVANFAMIEFMRPSHESAHFRPTDSDESPGRKWHDGKAPFRTNDGERPTQRS